MPLYVLALQSQETQYGPFLEACRRNRDYLNSSRPTAVNLRHMLDRVLAVAESMPCADVPSIQAAMGQAARAIHQEDIAMCTAISEYGLSLVKAGEAASSPTATPAPWPPPGTAPAWAPCFWPRSRASPFTPGVMKPAPLLQGARLTAYELQQAGIDCTLICDNMASLVMKEGRSTPALLGVTGWPATGTPPIKSAPPGWPSWPSTTASPSMCWAPPPPLTLPAPTGDHIPIELRDGGELKEKFFSAPVALPQVKCYNPAFDVTDHSLITAIVTEKGICYPPFEQSFAQVFGRPEKEAT